MTSENQFADSDATHLVVAGPPDVAEPSTAASGRPARSGRQAGMKALRGALGGVVAFIEGFRARAWEAAAEKSLENDVMAFRALRCLSDEEKQRLQPRLVALLRTRRELVRSQFAVAKVSKRMVLVLGIADVALPLIVLAVGLGRGWSVTGTYVPFLVGFIVATTWPARILQLMSGRLGAGTLWMSLALCFFVAGAAATFSSPGSQPEDAPFVAAVAALSGLAVLLVLWVFLLAWNETALRQAWAKSRIEAVVVDALLSVAVILDSTRDQDMREVSDDPYRPLQATGAVRTLLANAAAAVDLHLPTLLDSHPLQIAQARATAREISAALLELRSAADLPGGHAHDSDLDRVTTTMKAWMVGSIADLPRHEVQGVAPVLTSRWTTAFRVLRKAAIGVIPLILLIVAMHAPVTVPAGVTDALGPFAVTWLLISIASVFAPNDVVLDMKTLLGR